MVAQAGLKSENKPIGSFVFMGPTGTGKGHHRQTRQGSKDHHHATPGPESPVVKLFAKGRHHGCLSFHKAVIGLMGGPTQRFWMQSLLHCTKCTVLHCLKCNRQNVFVLAIHKKRNAS
jgi:hypothetical protein